MRQHSIQRGTRYLPILPVFPLLMLLAIAAAGCGASSLGSGSGGIPASQQGTQPPSAQPTSTQGTPPTSRQGVLSGKVVAGPTCPVERAEDPCQPVPVAHREVRIQTPGGTVAATVTTDAQGRFSATLAPGAYVVRVAIVREQVGLRQPSPEQLTVRAGKTTSVTIMLDTGIR
jgi:hypothetical protein